MDTAHERWTNTGSRRMRRRHPSRSCRVDKASVASTQIVRSPSIARSSLARFAAPASSANEEPLPTDIGELPVCKLGPCSSRLLPWPRSDGLRPTSTRAVAASHLAQKLPPDASGTIRVYSKLPVCPSCTGVIEQFYRLFPKITLLVTSGG